MPHRGGAGGMQTMVYSSRIASRENLATREIAVGSVLYKTDERGSKT